MTSLLSPGYAIRRANSCLNGIEVDCGTNVAPFHSCCPSTYTCPGPQYNFVCCPSGQNCTESLLAAPQPSCSNATWDMFDNGGFFCCEHGLPGYNRSNSNGCATPKMSLPAGIVMLSTVRVGVDPATIVSSASASSTLVSTTSTPVSTTSTTASATPTQAPSSKSPSTPVGAIAGGVIAGVAALALIVFLTWFFLRRKRNQPAAELQDNPYVLQNRYEDAGPTKYRSEVDGRPLHELGGVDGKTPHPTELPVEQAPVELDGQHRVRSS